MVRNQRSWVVGLILAVLLFSMACSFGNMIPSLGGGTASATPEASVPIVGNTAEATKPAAPTAPNAKATQPLAATLPAGGAPEISDVQAGLENLNSYRMTFTMTITGKDAKGADAKQDLNLLQEVIKSKESMRMSMKGTGWAGASVAGSFDIYQMGKTGYMMAAGQDNAQPSCLSFSSDKPIFDKNQMLTPEEMLGSLQTDNLIARGETVNGIKADHYKVRKADLGFGIATSQVGEMWIAQQGGYLVKLASQGDGDFGLSADKIKGTVVLTYDLTEVNKLADIALPEQCQASTEAIKDLPVPPNATDQSSFGEMLTFSSPDSTKTVADYYRKELLVKGWKITSDSNLDTVVMLAIQKDTRKFQIMITPGSSDHGASVIITKIP